MEMISLKIDDRDILAEKGSTILKAALENKIYIPHLCYHPDLKPAGACRVCLVELDNGQIVTSCRTSVKEGMVIKTKSHEVDRVRRPVIEMIIANHHMDCRNCLKKGQCELQRIMAYVKIDKKRIEENLRSPAVAVPVDESNPFFIRDHNKCVLCGICVQTCREIARVNAIDFAGRGNTAKIATFGDKAIAGSACVSCGECVIRCPVGALVVKKPQRSAREVRTICPYCGVGCGMSLGIREDKIVNVRADKESPVNKGHLCVKGRFGLGFVHSPDRLTSPLLKEKKGFKEVSWDEALEKVSGRLKKYKGEEVAVIASPKLTNEENYIAQKFARVVLGSNNIDTSVRLCHAPSIAAMVESNSIGVVNSEVNNIEQAGCILVAGANVTQSHPVLGIKIKKAVENGAKLIVISPKETGLCRLADIWLNPYPGTDLSLIMGMCSVIVEEELHDISFINEYSEKFDEFRESLEDFSPGRVERITGVARDKVEEAARIFANGKPSAILWDTGITQYSQGTNNVLGLINMSVLTGSIKHPSALIPLWGQNNGLGACTMGCLPDFYPCYQPVADPENRQRLEAAWGKSLNPAPGLTLTEILDSVSEGKIKALYIIGTDIATNLAPVRKVRDALKRAKFIVFQDMFLNETAKFAHIVLPAASFAEKDGTFTNTERIIQRFDKAIEPVGGSRADWQIMCELAKKSGAKGFDFQSAEEIMSEISSVAAGATPQMKRFRFTSLHYKLPEEVADIDYPLILTFERDLYLMGLLSRKSEGLNDLRSKDLFYINPKDAADFEIEDNETIKVVSRWGEMNGEARLTGSVPPGLISMNLIGEKVNQLLNPALDEVSKTPELKICAVRVVAQ